MSISSVLLYVQTEASNPTAKPQCWFLAVVSYRALRSTVVPVPPCVPPFDSVLPRLEEPSRLDNAPAQVQILGLECPCDDGAVKR